MNTIKTNVASRLNALRKAGTPVAEIVSTLKSEGFRTPSGKVITSSWLYSPAARSFKGMSSAARSTAANTTSQYFGLVTEIVNSDLDTSRKVNLIEALYS